MNIYKLIWSLCENFRACDIIVLLTRKLLADMDMLRGIDTAERDMHQLSRFDVGFNLYSFYDTKLKQ